MTPDRAPWARHACMIRLDAVTKVFSRDGRGVTALREVTLAVEPGETLALIGTSGCGKTTTLRLINRLEAPTSGTVHVKGEDVSRVDPIALRRRIGYVIQSGGLFPHLDVGQNISLLGRLEGWGASRCSERAEELLERVHLDADLRRRFPSELSGGQRQRVGVARALALDPEILLMDEPFGALDPITRRHLQEELVELLEGDTKATVLVTHDLDEAFRLGDRVGVMSEGAVLQIGSADELASQPATPFVAEFVERHRRG